MSMTRGYTAMEQIASVGVNVLGVTAGVSVTIGFVGMKCIGVAACHVLMLGGVSAADTGIRVSMLGTVTARSVNYISFGYSGTVKGVPCSFNINVISSGKPTAH